MGTRRKCPLCGSRGAWEIRRGKLKCKTCRREWQPGGLPLQFAREEWRALARHFVLGLSSNQVAEVMGVERRRVLRALTCFREAVLLEPPEIFSGTVEIDETYLGGRRKNQRKSQRAQRMKKGRGTTKTPVFGILCREGKVWAEVVPDIEAQTLLSLLAERVKRGSVVCSDTWSSYTGVAAKGYVHRLVRHTDGQYSDHRGSHINGLEGFWGYLKRRLAARGGIRRERLPLFLAEYVWRYNHRKVTISAQVSQLMQLLERLYLNRRTLVA